MKKIIFFLALIFSQTLFALDKNSELVSMPEAQTGLIKIDKNRNYYYETKLKPKSSSASLRFGNMATPVISNERDGIDYQSVYGASSIYLLSMEFEYNPFEWSNNLGGFLSIGLGSSYGHGRFKSNTQLESIEKFTLYTMPISFNAQYRFEYVEQQKMSPYLTAGVTTFLLSESRDDGHKPLFAVSPAINAGGGFLFSITSWDREGAFSMQSEYGISNLWFVADFKLIQCLNKNIDYSGGLWNFGVTVDF